MRSRKPSADSDCNQEEDSDNLHSTLRLSSHGVVAGIRRVESGGQTFSSP